MGIETEFPQFHTPKTQKQKSRIARVGMRKEISQFSLNPLSSRSSLSRTITRNSKLKESANSKAKPKVSEKGPNYIKLASIYTLSILGFWDLDGLLIW